MRSTRKFILEIDHQQITTSTLTCFVSHVFTSASNLLNTIKYLLFHFFSLFLSFPCPPECLWTPVACVLVPFQLALLSGALWCAQCCVARVVAPSQSSVQSASLLSHSSRTREVSSWNETVSLFPASVVNESSVTRVRQPDSEMVPSDCHSEVCIAHLEAACAYFIYTFIQCPPGALDDAKICHLLSESVQTIKLVLRRRRVSWEALANQQQHPRLQCPLLRFSS